MEPTCLLCPLSHKLKLRKCHLRWVGVRNQQIAALIRVVEAMKLILCTSQLEMLFQEDSMVAILWFNRDGNGGDR